MDIEPCVLVSAVGSAGEVLLILLGFGGVDVGNVEPSTNESVLDDSDDAFSVTEVGKVVATDLEGVVFKSGVALVFPVVVVSCKGEIVSMIACVGEEIEGVDDLGDAFSVTEVVKVVASDVEGVVFISGVALVLPVVVKSCTGILVTVTFCKGEELGGISLVPNPCDTLSVGKVKCSVEEGVVFMSGVLLVLPVAVES